jgi:dolichyl-phosphate-mannose-protein mannosyltransferase
MIPADSPKANYRIPGFFGKFLELNKVMWVTNADLTESHTWDSRPSEWPWLRRGINFWYAQHQSSRIDFVGERIIDKSISSVIQRFGGLRRWPWQPI